MTTEIDPFATDLDARFKAFYELMQWKVGEILLVSTPYDAWVLEEDCRLSERIVSEYKGLNLSRPPRLTWVATAEEALAALDGRSFDLVITMPRLSDMAAGSLGRKIKDKAPDLPVIVLSHVAMATLDSPAASRRPVGVDGAFVWSGDSDILVALIKSAEDRVNALADARSAGIRVILLVEDSPYYLSSLLPLLYREVVSQTQQVMQSGLNEEHRLLTMRARPKILIAESCDQARELFSQFEPYLLGVIADMKLVSQAGSGNGDEKDLLSCIKAERFDVPLLLTGTDPDHAAQAALMPAAFVDKNSPGLHAEVRSFFREQLGFGDFVFRSSDGHEIARASGLRALADLLETVPESSFIYHCQRNDISRWLFARSEIVLASKVRPLSRKDFEDVQGHRHYLASLIHTRRRRRQKGVVANFDGTDLDPDTEFYKIGKGSLGGKARGLAFVASLLRSQTDLHRKYENVLLRIPQTLVVTTDGFEDFVEENGLRHLAKADSDDEQVAAQFLKGRLNADIEARLRTYVEQVDYPLAVRSSSLLEDAQFHAYAGLYRTYMLPNDHPDPDQRLADLITAIKLVYASTYFQGPKAFSKRVGHRTEEEKMAVIIQQLVGRPLDGYFFPAISGVAQSHNYYPFGRMTPEDGIATIAVGLGKMVVAGERTFRFCPRYPQLQPQRASVDDILDTAQRHFYGLRLTGRSQELTTDDEAHLARCEVADLPDARPMDLLASTYVAAEHRIRDTIHIPGHRVITFAPILKHKLFPLAGLISDALQLGREGMGCPVEMEFSVNFGTERKDKPEFAFLQLRPMSARAELMDVSISDDDIAGAICYSQRALGNARQSDIADIVFVKPDAFEVRATHEMARQVAAFNARLAGEQRAYLLVGPGRWGSADPFLGIPVNWNDISAVGAIVEAMTDQLRADPSQGSHFFHNITTLGINYFCVSNREPDMLNWDWLSGRSLLDQSRYIAHVRLDRPLTMKVDGRSGKGVILAPAET